MTRAFETLREGRKSEEMSLEAHPRFARPYCSCFQPASSEDGTHSLSAWSAETTVYSGSRSFRKPGVLSE